MRKILFFCTVLICLISLFGCSFDFSNLNGDDQNIGKTEPTNNDGDEITKNENKPTKGEDYSSNILSSGKDYFDEKNTFALYDDLFDIENKITIKINISDSELAKIESDYQEYGSECNIYRLADSISITIDYKNGNSKTYTLEEVGIRMKGNTTRHSFYSNGFKSLIHFKLDFQETFDDKDIYTSKEIKTWANETKREERKNRTFFGLRGLELKYNAEGDLTYTRDVYSSYVYKTNGIYAQSTTLGVLDFNIGNDSKKSGTLGVYKIYEPVDRVFIKRYFPENNNDGDLYKAAWGKAKGMPNLNSSSNTSYGIDESALGEQKSVSYDLKTNKTKSNHEAISSLLKWINGNSKDLNDSLKNYINEDYYITWISIMYITGDWDNFMYDSNNYYMYFAEDGLCYFIPYDMDRTFGLQAKMHNMADKKPLDTWNLQGTNNRSNLLKKTIDVSKGSLRTKYVTKVKELAPNILNVDEFKSIFDLIYNNYKDDVVPTISTLEYDYEDKTSNPFYHLIIGNGEYIKYQDSTSNNNAFDSYFNKKQSVINNS